MLWLKALHVMAIISWMAGLLYIFRLYVYHAMETESVVMDRFQVMERRLWKAITVPAAWVSALTGFGMIGLAYDHFIAQPWLHVKLILVFALFGVHFYAGHLRKRLLETPHAYSHKFFRVMNEIPTLLMIGIVILVIVKPSLWR